MKLASVLWIADDRISEEYLSEHLGCEVTVRKSVDVISHIDYDALIVSVNGGYGERINRSGIFWLQQFRRKTHSKSPALLYSFEDCLHLANDFPMLHLGQLGMSCVSLPVQLTELRLAIERVVPMNDEQLQLFLARYAGLQEESARVSHALGIVVSDWEISYYQANVLLDSWEEVINECAPQLLASLKQLRNLFELMPGSTDSVRNQIELMQLQIRDLKLSDDGNENQIKLTELPDAPCQTPPSGFDKILVGDDTGWVTSAILRLQNIGYHVRVADTLKSARAVLEYQEYPILLSDLNFPMPKDGRILQSLGLEHCKLVIAISKDLADSSDLLPGVVDNCGGSRFQDADRIHSLIWQYAVSQGIDEAEASEHQTELGKLYRSIHNYSFMIKDRVERWRIMPEAIEWLIRRSESIRNDSPYADERLCIEHLLQILNVIPDKSKIPLAQLRTLHTELKTLTEQAKRLPGRDDECSLYNALHNSVGQHIALAASGLDDLDGIEDTIVSLERQLPDITMKTATIKAALSQCRLETSIKTLTDLEKALEPTESQLAQLIDGKSPMPLALNVVRARHFKIVSIEDQPIWQEFVHEAVSVVKASAGPGCTIDEEYYDNVEDALSALSKPASVPNPNSMDDWQMTIVITDMGLPATKEDAALVRQGVKSTTRRNGRNLLADLRRYKINLPTIVLSTPSDSFEDQLDLCEMGVADSDFIFKDSSPNSIDELVNAILRLMSRARVHEIYIGETDHCDVRIDGIAIPLEIMWFRTFYALCDLSSTFQRADRFFTAEEVVGRLDTMFGGYLSNENTLVEDISEVEPEEWWGDCNQVQFGNVVRLWAASKAQAKTAEEAIHIFIDKSFTVWKIALVLLDNFRSCYPEKVSKSVGTVSSLPSLLPEELYAAFESAFGIVSDNSGDYDPGNIEDHIYNIRLAVHRSFKDFGQFIDPRAEMLVRGLTREGRYGYRVTGSIKFADTIINDDKDVISKTNGRTFKVMVVENEPSYNISIRSVLDRAGFITVGANNRDDAIKEGLGTNRPDILSLDLHIPESPDEYAIDYRSGSVENGLEVLKCLRGAIPAIKVLVPTTLYDKDTIRAQAARLGVPVRNFVPKGVAVRGVPWESLLLLTASRLRQEIMLQVLLPHQSPTECPVVRIESGTNLSKGKLLMTVNEHVSSSKSGNQGMLLALLLSKPREIVSNADLQIAIYGRVANHNEWEGIKKNVRKEIREKWLGIKKDLPGCSATEILEDAGECLVLHALVQDIGGYLGT